VASQALAESASPPPEGEFSTEVGLERLLKAQRPKVDLWSVGDVGKVCGRMITEIITDNL